MLYYYRKSNVQYCGYIYHDLRQKSDSNDLWKFCQCKISVHIRWFVNANYLICTENPFRREYLKPHPEKCFVESTKISIGPYLNEKLY